MAGTQEPMRETKRSLDTNVRTTSPDDELLALEFDRTSDKLKPTANDYREMDLFGIKPVFKRRFKFVAMVGFASTVVMAWQNTLATFSFALANGGTGGESP